ncbi:MAG: exo-alpha-sialidase [Acidobacteria bacterium]|nr:exo-alpha-sialidase [Acidobacteriota bacterium]
MKPTATDNTGSQFSKEDIATADSRSPMLHSPAITQLADGRTLAAWYGGSREGAPDVEIYGSFWSPQEGWTTPISLMSAARAQDELGRFILKLGNPVLFTDRSGRTWLFFGTVSAGGWSTSDIQVTFSDDNAASWVPSQHLTPAPYTHDGTLVKGEAFEYSDETIGLPVYRGYGVHSFSELLRIDRKGRVAAIYDMADGTGGGLQPVVAPLSEKHGVAFQRYFGDAPHRMLRGETNDAGATWSAPSKTGVPNPDSAIAALTLSDGRLLLAYNNSEDKRDNLTLAISSDEGLTWKNICVLETADERAEPTIEFSYPQMIRDSGGSIQIVYTVNRNAIRHVVFNEAWINSLK